DENQDVEDNEGKRHERRPAELTVVVADWKEHGKGGLFCMLGVRNELAVQSSEYGSDVNAVDDSGFK
ncbi:MAG: hypothetical protein IIC18_09080, partial [Bacteroidetes bacterium]|nr:hypothetical protein [Bacteroidota bacterium]